MSTFIYILTDIILPIFSIIVIGFIAQKNLKMDIKSLTKLNIYVFVPAILFLKIYETEVTIGFFSQVLFYIIIIQAFMLVFSKITAKMLHFSKSIEKAFCNSLLFFNSGNYGLPLVELVFKGNAVAVTSQVFIMLIQNITTNTFGVFQASSGSSTTKIALKNILKMPSIYVICIIIIIKSFNVIVPAQILIPLDYISRGFIAIALLTLGAQLAEIKIGIKTRDVLMSSIIRLVVSPIIGFALVKLMGITGVLAQSLVIGVSTPSAVNTAMIAKEFDNEPEYASQIVFISTILSVFTVTLVVYLTGILL